MRPDDGRPASLRQVRAVGSAPEVAVAGNPKALGQSQPHAFHSALGAGQVVHRPASATQNVPQNGIVGTTGQGAAPRAATIQYQQVVAQNHATGANSAPLGRRSTSREQQVTRGPTAGPAVVRRAPSTPARAQGIPQVFRSHSRMSSVSGGQRSSENQPPLIKPIVEVNYLERAHSSQSADRALAGKRAGSDTWQDGTRSYVAQPSAQPSALSSSMGSVNKAVVVPAVPQSRLSPRPVAQQQQQQQQQPQQQQQAGTQFKRVQRVEVPPQRAVTAAPANAQPAAREWQVKPRPATIAPAGERKLSDSDGRLGLSQTSRTQLVESPKKSIDVVLAHNVRAGDGSSYPHGIARPSINDRAEFDELDPLFHRARGTPVDAATRVKEDRLRERWEEMREEEMEREIATRYREDRANEVASYGLYDDYEAEYVARNGFNTVLPQRSHSPLTIWHAREMAEQYSHQRGISTEFDNEFGFDFMSDATFATNYTLRGPPTAERRSHYAVNYMDPDKVSMLLRAELYHDKTAESTAQKYRQPSAMSRPEIDEGFFASARTGLRQLGAAFGLQQEQEARRPDAGGDADLGLNQLGAKLAQSQQRRADAVPSQVPTRPRQRRATVVREEQRKVLAEGLSADWKSYGNEWTKTSAAARGRRQTIETPKPRSRFQT